MKVIKLSTEELETLENIQKHNQSIIKEFGLINISQLNLDSRKARAEKFFSDLKKSEVDIAKMLEDKYGKGTVNLSTGEFNATKFN